jgi:hypothetical protein
MRRRHVGGHGEHRASSSGPIRRVSVGVREATVEESKGRPGKDGGEGDR